ncbi:MAG: glycosyltransferase family 2 protein [Clostridia bacterium]|nr:glycosyltransferase family 2 protein [Clostridia bacterium]
MSDRICAVVVTYNRKVLLAQCIEALLDQTYKKYDILLIDNASTDGTAEYIAPYLSERVKYFNTGANLGGSGGFYYGMKLAYEAGYDWIWIMDDDVIPTGGALKALVNAKGKVKTASFLASCVYSKDETAMNSPEISRYATNGYRFWYENLNNKMVRLAHATFVSLLINRCAIDKCGLPLKDYFIWGDDTEYTMRVIGRYGAAYIVGDSKVYHMREIKSNLNLMNEVAPGRIKMYYYMVRNTLTNTETYTGKEALKDNIKRYKRDCIKIALGRGAHRKLKIKTILKAIRDFKRRRYDVGAFNRRYDVYGQERAVMSFIGAPDIAELYRNRHGYTVSRTFENLSLFSVTGDVPAYLADKLRLPHYEPVSADIAKNYSELLSKKKTARELLLIDLVPSLDELVTLKGEGVSFNLSREAYAALCERGLAGDLTATPFDPTTLSDEELFDYVERFVLLISRAYPTENIVLVKREAKSAESVALTGKLYSLLESKFQSLKVVDLSGVSDEKGIEEAIENIL